MGKKLLVCFSVLLTSLLFVATANAQVNARDNKALSYSEQNGISVKARLSAENLQARRANAQPGVKALTKRQNLPAVTTDADMYGIRLIDLTTYEGDDFISFSSANPASVSSLAPIADACGAIYLGGFLYVVTLDAADNAFLTKYNAATYAPVEAPIPLSNIVLTLAYDYSTGTTYVVYVEADGESSAFGSIDLASGVVTPIASLTYHLYTLAVSLEGVVYGVDADGYLSTIDKSTGATYDIGYTGLDIAYMQSMTFDYSTGTLYWAALSTYYNYYFFGELYEVDLTTAEITFLGDIGGGAEVVGLYIPYTPVPSAVSNVKFDALTLSPNPTNGRITIEAVPMNSTIDVLDLSGRKVASFAQQSGTVALDLNIAAGSYLVQIINGNNRQVEKLIVR